MLRDVPATVYQDLAELLNPVSGQYWIHLAGRLGFTQQQIENYKLLPTEATQALLHDWGTRDSSTVALLCNELQAMERFDAVQVLHVAMAPGGTPV